MPIADLPTLPDLRFEKNAPGMALGHDALALARVVALRPGMRVLDLGTGQGVILLMLAARERIEGVGLERAPSSLEAARRNAARNATRLRGSVRWIRADLRCLPWPDGKADFDLVVINPPYCRAGEGRLPPDPHRAAARHELFGTLNEWVHAAAHSLRPGGMLMSVLRPDRQNELLSSLRNHAFRATQTRTIATAEACAKPQWVVLEAAFDPA